MIKIMMLVLMTMILVSCKDNENPNGVTNYQEDTLMEICHDGVVYLKDRRGDGNAITVKYTKYGVPAVCAPLHKD